MQVIGHDPFVESAADLPLLRQAASDLPIGGQPASNPPLVKLDEIFALSHVITLHCPPSADGRPLVDARRLGLAKPADLQAGLFTEIAARARAAVAIAAGSPVA